jgi:DNA-binding NarL/FixJ family response regulator
MDPMRILLVDDQVLFRKTLAGLLAASPGMEVVGEASDGYEAEAKAQETLPDVILMDISMSPCDGLTATRRISQLMPHVKIVMLTVSDDDKDLYEAIKGGAQGYLLKNLEPYQLLDMLRSIGRGETPLSGLMAGKILEEFRRKDPGSAEQDLPNRPLTAREMAVLELVAKGATNREIGSALFITEHTVKIHMRNILDKLHLQNRIQAAVYALREGLVGNEVQG